MKAPPLWHSEAKALRASGFEPKAIAARLGKSLAMVLWVLDEHGERQAVRARVQEARLLARRSLRRATDKPARHDVEPDQRRVRPAATRVNRETIDQAIRDFSEHKIDRATLMARITPRKWA